MKKFRAWFQASCICLLAASTAVACEYPIPPPFEETVARAHDIGIVQVVSEEMDPADASGETVIARVRRIETLRGKAYPIDVVHYYGGDCGGHRMDVGQYYLLVADNENARFDLANGDHSVLPLRSFGYVPPMEWARMHRRESDANLAMTDLRRMIAGKGAWSKALIEPALQGASTMPAPPAPYR
ncbi:MAG TPA: hypothetical protein VGH80_06150 [Xanthomonadaceae bacterium]|jgi:hypothetical protein